MDINRNNYETCFLNYLDRELSPADRQSVEKFISENADLQKEFLLLQQTILSPADIVFEPKASLYREEEKRRIIPFYRVRIAAAIAVLILGSWYLRSIVFKNNVRSLSGKVPVDAGKNNVVKENKFPAVKNETGKTILPTDNKNQTAVAYPAIKTPAVANKLVTVNTGETTVSDANKNTSGTNDRIYTQTNPNRIHARSIAKIHNQTKTQIRDQSDTQNQNQSNSLLTEGPESAGLASKKSSSALEIQSAARQTGIYPEQIPTESGTQTQTLVFAATKSNDPVQYKNAALKEQDFQNDNAISVVGLNDRNKAIAGFFKKLAKRVPADENARKLRVSVFQISY